MAEYDLKKTLAKLEQKRMNAVLYKGTKESQILLTSKPASPKQIEEIEKTCGEVKRVFKGLCFREGDKLIFGTKADPQPSWQPAVVKVLKDHHCVESAEIRKLGEHESDEISEEEVPPGAPPAADAPQPAPAVPPTASAAAPTQPPTDEGAAFTARLKGLLPELAKAIATGKPAGAEAKQKTSDAGNAAKTHDYAQANSLLGEAEKLVAAALGAPTASPDAVKAEWLKLKGDLTPKISAAVGANPPNRQALLDKLKAGLDKEKAADFAGAIGIFKELAGLLAGAKPASTVPPPPPPPPPPSPEAAQLNQALQKITPTIQQAVVAHPDRKAEIAHGLTAFKQALQAGKFAEAKQALAGLVGLLKTLAPAPTPTPAPSGGTEEAKPAAKEEEQHASADPNEKEWNKAFPIVDARFQKIMKTQPAEATRLRAMIGGASDLAGDGKFAEAVKALMRLDDALEEVDPDALDDLNGGYSGLVAYRTALLEYESAYKQVTTQIQGLKSAIPAEVPAETELADALVEALQAVNDEVRDAVDEALNAADNAAKPVTSALAKALDGCLETIYTNPLIQHADTIPFGSAPTIAETLGNALTKIKAAMPKAA